MANCRAEEGTSNRRRIEHLTGRALNRYNAWAAPRYRNSSTDKPGRDSKSHRVSKGEISRQDEFAKEVRLRFVG
jgi:hypothetical protein